MDKPNHAWIAEQAAKLVPDGLRQLLQAQMHRSEEGAWAPDAILKDMTPNHINKLDANGKRTGTGQNPEKVLFLTETIIDAHKLGFTPDDEMALWYFLISHYVADGNMPHHQVADEAQHETHQGIEDAWGAMAKAGTLPAPNVEVDRAFEGNVRDFILQSNERAFGRYPGLVEAFQKGHGSPEFAVITGAIQSDAISDVLAVWSHVWGRAGRGTPCTER